MNESDMRGPDSRTEEMSDYERLCDFTNLYKAHRAARLGKRNIREVIEFELHLAENLTALSAELKSHT